MTTLTDTITLLFNTPIVPPRRKKQATDIPLMELSGVYRKDRCPRDHLDLTEGIALDVRHLRGDQRH